MIKKGMFNLTKFSSDIKSPVSVTLFILEFSLTKCCDYLNKPISCCTSYLVHVVTNFCLITEYTQGPKSRGRQDVTSATPRSHEEVSYR